MTQMNLRTKQKQTDVEGKLVTRRGARGNVGLGIWDLMCSESVRVYFAYWYAVIQGNLKCLTKIKIKLKTKIW